MLAGNILKMCVGVGFEISLTLDLTSPNDTNIYSFPDQTKVKEELGNENELERSGSFWKQLNNPKKLLESNENEVKSYQNKNIDLLQKITGPKRKVTLGPKIVNVNKLSLLNLLKPTPQSVVQFKIPTYLKFPSDKSNTFEEVSEVSY